MQTYEDFGFSVPSNRGEEVDVMCPQCGGMGRTKKSNQRERTLSVNTRKQVWECHHCGWKGGLSQYEGPFEQPVQITVMPKPLQRVESVQEKAEKYLLKRGISQEIVQQERVTGVMKHCGSCGTMVEAIAFPYYRQNAHINTTYVHYLTVEGEKTKHVWQESKAERIFYGLDSITLDDPVIICEGQIDRLSFLQAGVHNVLSVPDGAIRPGAQGSDQKFAYLESAKELFDAVHEVILAGDNDEPGQALNDELARRIGREKCSKVVWPHYINDANEGLQKAGPALLNEVIEQAHPYPVEGLFHGSDVFDDVLDLWEHGYDEGLRVGLDNLDEHYRVRAGLMSIVTGTASHGKSLFVDHLMVRLAREHDWSFGVFSPENQPIKRHYTNLMEIYVQAPFHFGPTPRMSIDDVVMSKQWMSDHFSWILPEEPSVDTVLDRARSLVYRKGIRGLVMDPWNELEHARPNHKSETEYVSESLGKIRRFARSNDVHIWVLAHPTKMHYSRGLDGKPARPDMNDIAGSVHFLNKADFGLTVWRNPMAPTEPSEVIVHKIRFRETGKPGTVYFGYNPQTRQMVEV